jgi:hypothetical protein
LGDHSIYLIKVFIQDGTYFLVDFPTHLVSEVLKSRIPQHKQWATAAWNTAPHLYSTQEADKTDNMNLAAHAVFELVNQQIDCIENQLNRVANLLSQQLCAQPQLIQQN